MGDLSGGWVDGNGDWHPFVAIPTSIPETSSWAMMMLGFAGLGLASWRASLSNDRRAKRWDRGADRARFA